ncbi:hypothetical protein GCM10025864_11090 [Luteimicrobium album]|uniref:Uncharacterized protein n=1 Tax=Luteimicrobium album TaxID=1054550 RepID=A0ABQ6HXW3_9MICO|nr:hypothetical protein GCM10025864_11090 [Luteimicrobium album]
MERSTLWPRKVPRGYSYADHLPYDTPESLDELQGPTSGEVRLPPPIDTSLDPTYALSDPGAASMAIHAGAAGGERRAATGVHRWQDTVSGVGELKLPARCRAIWEAKFPLLRSAVPR